VTNSYQFTDWQSGKAPPDGWDAADAVRDGWGKSELDAFMRSQVCPWRAPDSAPEAKNDAPATYAAKTSPQAATRPAAVEARTLQQEQPEAATVTHIQTRKTVQADDGWMLDLVCNGEGKVKPAATKNWALFLENHPDMRGVFAWDAFKLRVTLQRCPPWSERGASWTPRVLQDRDYSEAVMWLEGRHMTPKASNIAAVIQTVAERAEFDRLREYLEGLKWDGKKRVDTWLTYYAGVEDGTYARTIGARWLISSVARGLSPGCKVDTMPILEGPQGARKSTALRALYGDEFFTDELSDIGSKDAIMEMQGVWGLEVAEMHRFNASETSAVKKFLSRQTDRYRPPYGRVVIEAPRRVCITGTINPEGNAYLKDPTGARRFWPITVGAIDTDAITKDRDQLWAEAAQMYRNKVPWWVQADEVSAVQVEQERRTDVDVWLGIIAPFVRASASVSQLEIFRQLGIPTKDVDYRHAGRVGRIMKKLGWASARDRSNGEDQTIFIAPQRDTGDSGGRDSDGW
jgi:predicted P-loop ATPase